MYRNKDYDSEGSYRNLYKKMTLTPTEEQIIETIRSLKPMETIIVRADAQGKAEKFFVKRTEAFFLVAGSKKVVADKLGLQM